MSAGKVVLSWRRQTLCSKKILSSPANGNLDIFGTLSFVGAVVRARDLPPKRTHTSGRAISFAGCLVSQAVVPVKSAGHQVCAMVARFPPR